MKVFAADSLQEVIHGRARLAILAFLTTVARAEFTRLREEIAISDGNLSQHLKKLNEAGYVELHKTIQASRTRTEAELTTRGRQAFYDYLDNLKSMLDAVQRGRNATDGRLNVK